MHLHRFAVLIILFSVTPLTAQDAKNTGPTLCRGNYHSEAEAVAQLARMASTYSNLDQWLVLEHFGIFRLGPWDLEIAKRA